MKKDINELISGYTRMTIEVDGIYEIVVPINSKSIGGRTMEGVCGFVIPIKGKAKFTVEGHTYDLEPGIIFHAGSNLLIDKVAIGNLKWEYALIHYRITEPQLDKSIFEKLHYSLNIGINCYSDIINLVRQLHQSVNNPRIISGLKSKAIFYSLLENILQNAQEKIYNSDEGVIKSITKYIDNHYDKNFNVNDLAVKYNMDSKHFYYIFQKCVGMCPKQYIMTCRINNAKKMLLNEGYSISKIASMVGYEDPFLFSRMFKKNTGLSPSHFREKLGKNPW